MAERLQKQRLKSLGRSASTESTEYSLTMGRSVSKKKKKPKERWLLTRKTWRYMADAGRKLIPEGAQNRPEDIPKIEAYFQEVCKKEPKFLLWRKNSYPGALGFRKKRKDRPKGGSCRKACSADQVDLVKPERPKDLALISSNSGGRFDIQKLKYDFLNKPPSPTSYVPSPGGSSSCIPKEFGSGAGNGAASGRTSDQEEQLIKMLEQYLTIDKSAPSTSKGDFNYQELVDKLQRHLSSVSRNITAFPNYPVGYHHHVHFSGDYVQKSLSETLSRYFSQSTNRDKIISDLLTDRKTLEKLYFELRKTKGFRSSRSGAGYSPSSTTFGRKLTTSDHIPGKNYEHEFHPPPLIEIESESTEIYYNDWGIQTMPIPEMVLCEVEEKYKKLQAEKEEEDRRDNRPAGRRRSSVDNDDISQSVSDTIKRYLRMARKKSVDTDAHDRFKRVNYDRNLRNIKPKGEITKPGDDDGLNKGCQTDDDWILRYRDLKFDDISDVESRVSSSRSSIDVGIIDENNKSSPSSPPSATKSHSFLSNLLHGGKHEHKSDKNASAAVMSSTSGGGGGATMQKSKSSSSVMHHGSRLMAKKIFRSRSKSQTRPSQATCSWTPQGSCVWHNLTGRQVILNDTSLLQLSEIERKVLQKVALAKLQALNLGVAVKVPTDTVGALTTKPKRRPYLLKRKAITTSIFDTNRKEGEKDGSTGGLVFGIPLTQCVENDRLSRTTSRTSPFQSGPPSEEPITIGRHGSRSSFSSLIEAPRGDDESGSCESLMLRERLVGSVPGLLDTLSCGSTADLPGASLEEEVSVPNILNACFRHIEQHGLHTLGIFRVSTSKKRIRQLREDFDCGKETSLDEGQCPHDVATLLKEYLRDLPDPLLCRDLYHAFVHTQRIRNRRLQFEALQHLIQLLPAANRDTLFALLSFLAIVARNSEDTTNDSGECLTGNKMDSNNLATVFAPNILHCIKHGSSKDSADRPEDRIDIINVVRTLIDHYKNLFNVTAELLDEIYVHMMDSHPEALDQLLNKKDAVAAAADESVEELDSESYSAHWSPTAPTSEISIEGSCEEPKKTYSREEFLHEAAATGGPNIGMRIRHKDRTRERPTSRKKRDDSTTRRKKGSDDDSGRSSINIISRLRGQKDDDYQSKTRSSSLESTSSTHTDSDQNRILRITSDDERRKSSPYVLDDSGVITASLTIPVQTTNQSFPLNLDDDIPYIEDGENGRQQLTIGLVRQPTAPPRRRQRSISGSDSSVASNQPISGSVQIVQGYDSAVGSSTTTYSSPIQHQSSISSSTADVGTYSSPPSWGSTPPTSPDSAHTSVNYIPDDHLIKAKAPTPQKTSPILQKVSFSSTQQVQQIAPAKLSSSSDIHKSYSASNFEQTQSKPEKEPKFTPSISSIGNAVLRSRTQDFERITKTEPVKPKTSSDVKKYTKRRYTDSRHQTRHIPDSETLESSHTQQIKEDRSPVSQAGPVYKRRELISSVPSK